MSLISKTSQGMYNGISQQPASLREDNQFEKQVNFVSDIVKGIERRPNSEYLATLNSQANENSFIYTINRSLLDKYKVIFTGDAQTPIEIFDIQGNPYSVQYATQDAKDYVASSDPREYIKALSLKEETFIVNSEVTVAELEETVGDLKKTQMAWVKKGIPEIDYTLTLFDVDGNKIDSVTYESQPSSTNTVETTKTNTIADELVALAEPVIDTSNYTIWNDSSVIYFRYDGTDRNFATNKIKIETADSFGDTSFIAINGRVNDFTDLPPNGIEYYPIAVTGNRGIEEGAFYVEFDKDEQVWLETRALYDLEGNPLPVELDATTMPHIMKKIDATTFEISIAEWEKNTVGDHKTSASPSFVDNTINDIFFYRNRIGFLSGSNIIMTANDEYYNLFPKTATSVLDTDPIDVTAKTNQETDLKHAVAFTRSLIVFSEQVQFAVGSAGTVLTPQTITVDPSTYFETSPMVYPVPAGANIYFCVPKGNYTGVREYYVETDSLTNNAEEITKHVPQYIPKNVKDMTASSVYNNIFLLSDEEKDTIYTYTYQWAGDQKIQNSWSKWKFEDQIILDMQVAENYLYLTTKKDDNVLLVKLDLRQASTGTLPIKIYLDGLVETTGTYNEQEENTYFNLPYTDSDLDKYQVVDGDTGLLIDGNEVVDSDTIRIKRKLEASKYYIGRPMESKVQFNRFYIKNQNGIPDIQGKIQLKTLTLGFTETGAFKLLVRPYGRHTISGYIEGDAELEEYISTDMLENRYSGVTLGEAVLNTPPVRTDEYTFPVTTNGRTVLLELVADTHLPASFQFYAYEAEYNNRANHIR